MKMQFYSFVVERTDVVDVCGGRGKIIAEEFIELSLSLSFLIIKVLCENFLAHNSIRKIPQIFSFFARSFRTFSTPQFSSIQSSLF